MEVLRQLDVDVIEACDSFKKRLRDDFPYLKTAALDALVQSCITNVKSVLTQQYVHVSHSPARARRPREMGGKYDSSRRLDDLETMDKFDLGKFPLSSSRLGTPAMDASKARSGFMTLSPELRNRIYLLLVTPQKESEGGVRKRNKYAVCIQDGNAEVVEDVKKYGTETHWQIQPAITRVSRELRAETLPMYYGLNEFVAYSDNPENWSVLQEKVFQHTHGWLSSIGKANVALIKRFTLFIPWWEKRLGSDVTDLFLLTDSGMDRAVVTVRPECEICERWHRAKHPVYNMDGEESECEGKVGSDSEDSDSD